MKPYTLEELDNVKTPMVWIEYRLPQYTSHHVRTVEMRAFWAGRKGINRSHYGRTWRCWSEKPSEEDRLCAKWEGDVKE